MSRDLKNGRIVIVGAALAGLRAAEALREEGFTGELTMVGEERELPYDRPPLSKQVLLGRVRAKDTGLPRRREVDAKWKLGMRAIGVDPIGKRVLLADGEELPFDRLLIATGTRARPWPNAEEAALDGVFTLRTCEDAARLAERLNAGPRRVLVIGAGFTGSEIASACRERDIEVTVAERGPAPLVGALGGAFGALAAKLQLAHGVDLRCGVTVTALTSHDGRLTGAELSDGARIEADIAVVALGAVRNTEWLAQSGLAAGPRGVACDAGCRVFNMYGIVTDDVFVAGDVAPGTAAAPPPRRTRLLVQSVRPQHQVRRRAHLLGSGGHCPGLVGEPPTRRGLRLPGPRHGRRQREPCQMAGALRAADRDRRAVPARARHRRPICFTHTRPLRRA